jgi:hypothetical protein
VKFDCSVRLAKFVPAAALVPTCVRVSKVLNRQYHPHSVAVAIGSLLVTMSTSIGNHFVFSNQNEQDNKQVCWNVVQLIDFFWCTTILIYICCMYCVILRRKKFTFRPLPPLRINRKKKKKTKKKRQTAEAPREKEIKLGSWKMIITVFEPYVDRFRRCFYNAADSHVAPERNAHNLIVHANRWWDFLSSSSSSLSASNKKK